MLLYPTTSSFAFIIIFASDTAIRMASETPLSTDSFHTRNVCLVLIDYHILCNMCTSAKKGTPTTNSTGCRPYLHNYIFPESCVNSLSLYLCQSSTSKQKSQLHFHNNKHINGDFRFGKSMNSGKGSVICTHI
jgi:hypothetical protein